MRRHLRLIDTMPIPYSRNIMEGNTGQNYYLIMCRGALQVLHGYVPGDTIS